MSDDPKINFWLSWYGELPMSEFELHSPWWISGYDAEDRPVICAAIQATSAWMRGGSMPPSPPQ